MKNLLRALPLFLLLAILALPHMVWGQGSESFTNLNASGSSYGAGSYTGDNSIVWSYGEARSVTSTYNITGRSIGFGSSGTRFVSASVSGGVGNLTYSTRTYFTGGSASDRTIELYVDGVLRESFTLSAFGTVYTRTVTGINVSGTTTIEFRSTGSRQVVIDEVSWTAGVTLTPDIEVSTTQPSGTIERDSDDNILGVFELDVTTAAATLTDLDLITSGDYEAADLDGDDFKLYYNTTNTLTGATEIATFTSGSSGSGELLEFNVSQSLPIGTHYLLITADVACAATLGRTIALDADDISDIALTFSATPNLTAGTIVANQTRTFVNFATPTVNATTGFSATATSTTNIDLSWTAPAAGATPDGYTILVNNTGSFTDPVGNVADDADFSDNTAAYNVTGTSLSANIFSSCTQAFFAIYPYVDKCGTRFYHTASEQTANATTSNTSSSTIFSEDFTGFSGSAVPAGWSNVSNNGVTVDRWRFDNPGSRTLAGMNGTFAIFDSDNISNNGTPEDVDLITESFDCSSFSTVTLTYDYFYEHVGSSAGRVYVSGNNGSTWTLLRTYSSNANATETIDISSTAAGQSQVRLRFNFTGDWSWYFAVDDISVSAPGPCDIDLTIAGEDPNPSVDFTLGSFNNALYAVQITANGPATLDSIAFEIDPSATVTLTDIPSYKIFYSTDNVWDASDVQLGSAASGEPGDTLKFSGLGGSLTASANNYILLTADIDGTGTGAVGKTVGAELTDIGSVTILETLGTRTASAITGGTLHTIVSPSVQFNGSSSSRTEGTGGGTVTANIPIQLFGSIPTSANITINIAGTATEGTDYTIGTPTGGWGSSVAGSVLTLTTPGTTLTTPTVVNIPISIARDALFEADETIELSLASAAGIFISSTNNTYTFTISNDDSPSEVNFRSSTLLAGEGVTYTVRLDISPAQPVAGVLNILVSNAAGVTRGTASPDDYNTAPAVGAGDTLKISVPANATQVTFDLETFNDGDNSETDQFITFSIVDPPGPLTMTKGGSDTLVVDITNGTRLNPGDFAVLSFRSSASTCPSDDGYSFVCFQDLLPGTSIQVTDNGWQRANANQWGDTEGFLTFTYEGATTIPAGTVINVEQEPSPSAVDIIINGSDVTSDWSVSTIGSFAFNNSGDQLFFLQGGEWVNPGGTHDATYTGQILFAVNNSSSGWETGTPGSINVGTQRSFLPEGMECFNIELIGDQYVRYFGDTTIASKREWVIRFSNPVNWDTHGDCDDMHNISPVDNTNHYDFWGYTGIASDNLYRLRFDENSEEPGRWVGDESTDWFDCANWQALEIPDAETDVIIPDTTVTNDEPTINGETAAARNLTIEDGRTLTITGTGALDLNGSLFMRPGASNIVQSSSANLINFTGTSSATIDSSDVTLAFMRVEKAASLTLDTNLTITGNLDMAGGNLILNGNTLTLNSATVTETDPSSLISGATVNSKLAYTGSNNSNLTILDVDQLEINRPGQVITMVSDVTLRGQGLDPLNIIAGELALNNNTLTINDGTMVIAATNGRLRGTSSSTLLINGDDNAGVLRFNSSFDDLGTLTLNKTGSSDILELGSDLTVHSALNLTDGDFQIGNNTLTINNRINTSSGTMTGGANSNLVMGQVSSTTPSTTIPAIAGGLNNLTINRNLGVSLGGDLEVDNVLTFTDGILSITGTNSLTLSNPTASSAISGASQTNYVSTNGGRTGGGSLIYSSISSGDGSFTVPIGITTNPTTPEADYTPITFENTDGSATDFAFRVFNNVYQFGSSGRLLTDTVVAKTWVIEDTAGTRNFDLELTFEWQATHELNDFNRSLCRVYKSDNPGDEFLPANTTSAAATGSNPYQRTVNGVTSLSMFAVGSNIFNPLPLTLMSFEGQAIEEGALLTWSTSHESKLEYFELQKSTNDVAFTSLARITPRNHGDAYNTYSFIDEQFNASSYYRLRVVEEDGTVSYFKAFIQTDKEITVRVFPNPARDRVQLLINGIEEGEQIRLEMTGLTGQTIFTAEGNRSTLEEMLNKHFQDIPQGLYPIHVTVGKLKDQFMLIKE